MTGKGNNLVFSKKKEYSLYELEDAIQRKEVKYGGHVIQPTFSYMISAHGAEYQKKIPRGHHRTYSATYIGDPTPKPTQNPTVDAVNRKKWDLKSTVYFFVPRWDTLISS